MQTRGLQSKTQLIKNDKASGMESETTSATEQKINSLVFNLFFILFSMIWISDNLYQHKTDFCSNIHKSRRTTVTPMSPVVGLVNVCSL